MLILAIYVWVHVGTCQRGIIHARFWGERIQIPLRAGYHQPASERHRWRADNGPKLNAGLVALLFLRGSGPVLLRNLYFSGGGGPDP